MPLVDMNKKTGKVVFKHNDERIETSILDGIVLQWKVIGQCDGLLLMLILRCTEKI